MPCLLLAERVKKIFQLSNFLNGLQLQNLQLGMQQHCCPYTHTLRLVRNGFFEDMKELSCLPREPQECLQR